MNLDGQLCRLVRLHPPQTSMTGLCLYRRAEHELGDGRRVWTAHVTHYPTNPIAKRIGTEGLLLIGHGEYYLRPIQRLDYNGVEFTSWDPRRLPDDR